MFEFPAGQMAMNLNNEALLINIKTKIKQRILTLVDSNGIVEDPSPSDKLRVKWSHFNFGKGGLDVIFEDIKMAEEVLEKI